MAQDMQQLDDEVDTLRKARNDLEEKLVTAMENRSARKQEEAVKAKLTREKHSASSPRREESSDGTRSPSTASRSASRRGRRPPQPAPQRGALEWYQGEREKRQRMQGKG